MAQIVLNASKGYSQLDDYFRKINTKVIFLFVESHLDC